MKRELLMESAAVLNPASIEEDGFLHHTPIKLEKTIFIGKLLRIYRENR